MDDPQPVRLDDRARERLDQRRRTPRRPWGAVEPPVEPPALEVLQLEVGQAVGLADVVDLDDVGVLEPRDGRRLGQEAGGGHGIGVGTGQDHLEGARAVEADLTGVVDDAHAAAAELTQDLVAGDRRDRPCAEYRWREGVRIRRVWLD